MSVLGGILVGLGVALMLIAGIGLLRLPDVYARTNAVTKAASLGVTLILLGALALSPGWVNAAKVLLAIALQLVTAPIGGYAVSRAAYRAGAPLSAVTRYDELAERTRGR